VGQDADRDLADHEAEDEDEHEAQAVPVRV
jgi:hypothetical protein